MPSSTSAPSTQSPISTVPYEILIEILVHCLPRDRFEIRQPNTTIAPLLLCHICSSWRTIALTTPALWSHLSFRFTLNVFRGGWSFLQDEIDFIRWWKTHQGSNAPFLRLAIERDHNKAGSLARDTTTFPFVLHYMRMAQHLEIDPLFWNLVPPVYDEIADRIAFPNLHTLVTYEYLPRSRPEHYFHHTFTVLRRLAVVNNNTSLRDTVIPPQWATLTHLSITTLILSLDFWLHLTSSVPNLRWAYIYFNHQSPFDVAHHQNRIRTLPHLATLFIGSGDNNINSPLLSPLFMGLHLPALTTLALSSPIQDWWDHTGITDIHAILSSTPALRNLTLRKYNYLSRAEIGYARGPTGDGPTGDVQQIWRSAPHLVDLQLDLHISRKLGEDEAAEELDRFSRSFFLFDNRWLALDDPACPIKWITVVDPGLIPLRDEFTTDAQWKPPSIRGCMRMGSNNISLHVLSRPFTDFSDSWKEWRSGN